MTTPEPLCLTGGAAIGRAIGYSRTAIPALVEERGLPAWRDRGTGPWKATPEDLRDWLRRERDAYLRDARQRRPPRPRTSGREDARGSAA